MFKLRDPASLSSIDVSSPPRKLAAHNGYVLHTLFSPDGSYVLDGSISPQSSLLASCGSDSNLNLYNPHDWSDVKTLSGGHKHWVWDCEFSSDSNYLLSGNDSFPVRFANFFCILLIGRGLGFIGNTMGYRCRSPIAKVSRFGLML